MGSPPPSRDEMLRRIGDGRAADPLAPVTVICPSHLSALQMRRALAASTGFAAVRFETLPRLAELLGAGRLAAEGRRPMARPIGDHVAELVALEARPPLDSIRELPGFARALRRLFARLRRAGLRGGDAPAGIRDAHLAELVRLYGLWRERLETFYDEDDLLDAAAQVVDEEPGHAGELGALHLVPPGPRSWSGDRLLAALARAGGGIVTAADPAPADDVRLVMAPDLACEAREVAREVLDALEEGLGLHEVAVLHGADDGYAEPLREALHGAGLPVAAVPGTALARTPAGRGLLALLEVALSDLSRATLIDALGLAPMRRDLPGAGGARVPLRLGRWDRLSRAAGVTHGAARWREGIGALCDDRRDQITAAEREGRDLSWLGDEIEEGRSLLGVVLTLDERLGALRPAQPAAAFIGLLDAIVTDYLDPDAVGAAEVRTEVERLGTIDAVGGTFTLAGFHRALRANLEAASIREGRAGEGVLVADHRAAAGLGFVRVVLCGAAEGLLPAGPGPDVLVADAAWAELRRELPFTEDAALRGERAAQAAHRAAGAGRTVVMTCPLYADAGTHERHPSALALAAARRHDPHIETATALRAHPQVPWLRRPASPLAAQLRGHAIDAAELSLRAAVRRAQAGQGGGDDGRLARGLAMARARAGAELSEWDGNLGALTGSDWLSVPSPVSPTRLEIYGACGYRFFLSTILRLRAPEEPLDPETLHPIVRGNIVHGALEAFFRERQAEGRPAAGEPWGGADAARLRELLDEQLAAARARGLGGLAVFARAQERALRADMDLFLEADTAFRRSTGAVPHSFEQRIDVVGPGGQRFTGYVDRIDRDPAGRVWIVDYKTGRRPQSADSPFGGGTLLQLPVYLLGAAGAPEAVALYWYISASGGFETVPYAAAAATFGALTEAIRAGVAAGSFPAVPGDFDEHYREFANCGRCDFTRICAGTRADDFARKAAAGAVAPWAAVAAAARGGDA